ncbi:MAG: hypothetical protein ABSE46_19035 [Terracidiphilus sp.]|jgi:hypothetical protein
MIKTMCKRFRPIAIAVGVLALCAVASVPAMAQVYSTCGQYETYTENGYNLYTDEWGASSGGCLYANSSTNWWYVANYPSSGSGVQAYPDTEISLGNVNLTSLSAVNSSFNFSVSGSTPYYDAAYDLWTNGNVDEVMVWEQWKGDGPIASSYSCNQLGVSGCPFATNVSLGGETYDVFQGYTNHNVVSFLRTSQASSGSVNLLTLMNWLVTEGKLTSKTFSTADFGFEIGDTDGGSGTFTVNSYSLSFSSGGSCTPTSITPYISVNNGSSWAEENSATVGSTSTQVDLGPQPTSGGSWSWSGPSGYSSTSRQISDIPLKTGSNVYTATYTNSSGCKSTEAFTITVN